MMSFGALRYFDSVIKNLKKTHCTLSTTWFTYVHILLFISLYHNITGHAPSQVLVPCEPGWTLKPLTVESLFGLVYPGFLLPLFKHLQELVHTSEKCSERIQMQNLLRISCDFLSSKENTKCFQLQLFRHCHVGSSNLQDSSMFKWRLLKNKNFMLTFN